MYIGDGALTEAVPAERHQHLAGRLPPADVVRRARGGHRGEQQAEVIAAGQLVGRARTGAQPTHQLTERGQSGVRARSEQC